MEPTLFLSGADVAMVVVTIVLVQAVKFFLPAPPAPIPGAVVSRWSVAEAWKWVPLFAAFVISIVLSIVFDQHDGQSLRDKLREGLQTGAYTVAVWEMYSQTFRGIISRLREGR